MERRRVGIAAEILGESARQGVSQSGLAAGIGVHRNTLSRWLDGANLTTDRLGSISAFLGVPASELMRRAEAAELRAVA